MDWEAEYILYLLSDRICNIEAWYSIRNDLRIKYKEASSETLLVKRGKNLGLNVKKIEKKLGVKMPSSNQAIYNLVKEYK